MSGGGSTDFCLGDEQRKREAQELMDRIAASSLVKSGDGGVDALVSSRQLARKDRRPAKMAKSKPVREEKVEEEVQEEEQEREEEEEEMVEEPVEPMVEDDDEEALEEERELVAPVVAPEAPVAAPRADPQLSSLPPLSRPQDIALKRMELPVQQHEADVLGNVSTHDVIVVVAPTGSGKTTQLPQWLLEYGYRSLGMIAVTQPRKLACRMVSSRIAAETGLRWGDEIGYHTRHDKHYDHWDTCKVLLCTDGLLLAAARTDQLLQRYSVIVVDEAHERTLHTDVLLGLLSRVVVMRRQRWQAGGSVPPLKVVIMSATLDIDPLASLFTPKPCVMELPGRQYAVTTHHLLRTPTDLTGALEAAVKAVRKIVSQLPRGCILVFVPGKREIQWMIGKLTSELAHVEAVVDLLPLFAGQSQEMQQLPFEEAREHGWKIVVATNIAECSLTIPDARYVVDTGYTRSQLHDGVFVTQPCSQASANQRTGRAGRTREGHCYRMYSSAFYQYHMSAYEVPAALRVAPEELLMQMLALGVSRPVNFPLPSSPGSHALMDAARRLHTLGLLTSSSMPLQLTVLGTRAMKLPITPAQARFVLTSSHVRLASLICGVWSAQQLLPAGMVSGKQQRDLGDDQLDEKQRWWKKMRTQCDVMSVVEKLESGEDITPAHRTALVLAGQIVRMLEQSPDEPMPRSLVPTLQALLGACPWTLCRRDGKKYISLMDEQPVYLHPTHCSREFAQARHSWIACLSFLTLSERRYAVYPFHVQPQWLFDVLPGANLVDYSRVDEASATFDEQLGCVVAECSPRYGPLGSALPLQRIPFKNGAVFAKLLLTGEAGISSLAALSSSLRISALSLLTPPFPETCTRLLKVMERVHNMADLAAINRDTLLDAVLPFYVPAARPAARTAWTNLFQTNNQ